MFFPLSQHRAAFLGTRTNSEEIKKLSTAVTKQSTSINQKLRRSNSFFWKLFLDHKAQGSGEQKGQEWVWGHGRGQQPGLRKGTPGVLKISTGARSTEHFEELGQGLPHTRSLSFHWVQKILSKIFASRWSSLNSKAQASSASINSYWNYFCARGPDRTVTLITKCYSDTDQKQFPL